MKTYARLRHCGVPALKLRRFGQTIKGEPVERALAILDLQPSPSCHALGKLLRSAIANAQHNNQLAPEFLVVSNIMVDQGPTMKRIRPRARGRAYRVLKRSSHITIELDLKPGFRPDAEGVTEDTAASPKRKRRAKPEPKKPVGEEQVEQVKEAAKPKRKAKAAPQESAAEKTKAAEKPAKGRAKKTGAKPKAKKDADSKEKE